MRGACDGVILVECLVVRVCGFGLLAALHLAVRCWAGMMACGRGMVLASLLMRG